MNASPETMTALRVVARGATTSFRHAHFVHGTQPTYPMPPPATLYGHICSALGYLADPSSFHVAFAFEYAARFVDYEHTYIISPKETKLSPFRRECFFRPVLTLYINRPDWRDAFLRPAYPLVFGRSQDLMTYSSVEVTTLERAGRGFANPTLTAPELLGEDSAYTLATLPRMLSAEREADWQQYAVVTRRQPVDQPVWVDPTSISWKGRRQAVLWLDLTG